MKCLKRVKPATKSPAEPILTSLVVIFLRATGNAPILKQNKFKVSTSHSFLAIQDFVRKQLLLQDRDSLVKL